MAPDVTFAWFIRHFTLSEELLLTASQISSCLLSSNCLRLTFIKSRMTRKMKNVVTSPASHSQGGGELYEISSFRVVTPQPASNIPSQIQLTTKDCDGTRKLSRWFQPRKKKSKPVFLVGEKVQWNYINIFIASLFAAAGGGGSRFIWRECRTSIYPAITRR